MVVFRFLRLSVFFGRSVGRLEFFLVDALHEMDG